MRQERANLMSPLPLRGESCEIEFAYVVRFGLAQPHLFVRTVHGRRCRARYAKQAMKTKALTSNGWLPILLCAGAAAATAQQDNFDGAKAGAPLAGWTCGTTGPGSPKWSIEADASAPSKPNVLMQSGSAAFPWCVKTGTTIADGFVEVKFKALAGREDQAAGLVWRWKDGDNYYVARANALENNVSLYYTEKGKRNTLKYVDAPVERNQWHALRVEYSGKRITVMLNGKRYIELEDDHIAGTGAVGVWTKADSVTAFDDFTFSPIQ
jgi:hypothetical protein